ncbi:MAG TPA: biotin/lipoyl-containing protein, partial [Actinotalea sp.]|nr:biotin/lipoyl-containing protein [Actinotalea sp.]
MSDSVLMPALGESVTEGTVTRWLKAVGDTVALDEPLLEVSTDKVDTEIPSPFAGTLVEILVGEDETVAVGTALAVIGEAGGGQHVAPAAEPAPVAAAAPEQAPEPAAAAVPAPPAAPAGDVEGQEVAMPALGESVTEGTVTR